MYYFDTTLILLVYYSHTNLILILYYSYSYTTCNRSHYPAHPIHTDPPSRPTPPHAPFRFEPHHKSILAWAFATTHLHPIHTPFAPHSQSTRPPLEPYSTQHFVRFEPHHLSILMWAFATLDCKPVKLLKAIEAQAKGSCGGNEKCLV